MHFLRNAKNLYGKTTFIGVACERGVELMESELKSGKATGERASDLAWAIERLRTLPSKALFVEVTAKERERAVAAGDQVRSAGSASHNNYNQIPWRGWLKANGFVGSASGWGVAKIEEGQDPEAECGWAAAEALAKDAKRLEKILSAEGLSFNAEGLASAKGLAKKLAASGVRWEFEGAQKRLALAESFALHDFGRGQYLGEDGSWTQLSGARLFESAEAAARTARSRKLTGRVVVAKIEARVVGIDPSVDGGNVARAQDSLGVAVAAEERRQIEEALGKADMEALRSRVAQLEARLSEAGGLAEAPAARRARI